MDHNISQEQIKRMMAGIDEFAWMPTKLDDDSWTWLKHYFAIYDGGTHRDGTVFLWSCSPEENTPMAKRFRYPEDATAYKLRK